jgi:hypothetical protein
MYYGRIFLQSRIRAAAGSADGTEEAGIPGLAGIPHWGFVTAGQKISVKGLLNARTLNMHFYRVVHSSASLYVGLSLLLQSCVVLVMREGCWREVREPP